MDFIGRTEELKSLEEFIASPNSNLAVVYGRRRIGKSELLKQAFSKEKVIFIEGIEHKGKAEQIDNFLFQLAYAAGIKSPIKATKWRDALIALYEVLKENPMHVVLDEFQWMSNYRSDFISDFKMIWDQYLSKIEGVSIVFCGSIASFMLNKVMRSSALYGRIDLQLSLKEFCLYETRQLLQSKGIDEVIDAHLFSGGVPKYLNLLNANDSIQSTIEKLAFTPSGYFVEEYDRIFVSHFGKNLDYQNIIESLSQHPYGLFRKQISEKAGVKLGGLLTEQLSNLEAAGFITSDTPYDKGYDSKLIKYFLTDAYLRFYFSFIKPNLKSISKGTSVNLYASLKQEGLYYNWLGRSFEYLCIQHATKIAELLKFDGIKFSYGPYFRAPKLNQVGVQVDLIFDRADHVMTICEMKYSQTKLSGSVIDEMEKKVNVMSALHPRKTIQKVLITNQDDTKAIMAKGYFYRVICVDEFM